MWELLVGLHDWILSLADKFEENGLKPLTEKDIIYGVVDLSRYENRILLSIMPDTSEDTEEYDFIEGQGVKQNVTLTLLLRKRKSEQILQLLSDYEKVINNEIRIHPSLGGLCHGCGIGERKYFLDAGAIEDQLVAVEIPLTLLYEELLQ